MSDDNKPKSVRLKFTVAASDAVKIAGAARAQGMETASFIRARLDLNEMKIRAAPSETVMALKLLGSALTQHATALNNLLSHPAFSVEEKRVATEILNDTHALRDRVSRELKRQSGTCRNGRKPRGKDEGPA